ISLFLSIAPIFWHWKQKNVAPLFLIFWVVWGDLSMILNSIPFGGPDITKYWNGHVYCDITSRMHFMAGLGIISSLTATSRSLARIMTGSSSLVPSPSYTRKEWVINIFYCVFIPLFGAALYYIYEGGRYIIYQNSGCVPYLDASWVCLICYTLWTPILVLISTYYSGCTVYFYWKRQRRFREILHSNNSGLTLTRLARLFIFSLSIVLVALPLSIYVLVKNIQNGVKSFSWSATHDPTNWSQIIVLPNAGPRYDFLFYPLCALCLFLFFGLGSDAKVMYRDFFISIG
ncbi:GPCR fungal pheromone mating factor, partial [Lipomyces oligophaga]|uniref:GPCR fungal pheromone mating factor n=1 Tax=Lipomyces oligophaga TaxID=45792 RepID=UPI0034CD5AE1